MGVGGGGGPGTCNAHPYIYIYTFVSLRSACILGMEQSTPFVACMLRSQGLGTGIDINGVITPTNGLIHG